MTNPRRHQHDLRVHIQEREPDEVFLARLTALARASGEVAALPDRGPARWKVALAAASVAAIASGGAALADALNGTERPSPVAPPTPVPTDDDRPESERGPRPDRSGPDELLETEPEPEPDIGYGGRPDPSGQGASELPQIESSHESDDDEPDPDTDTDDEPDDDTSPSRDEVRDDDEVDVDDDETGVNDGPDELDDETDELDEPDELDDDSSGSRDD